MSPFASTSRSSRRKGAARIWTGSGTESLGHRTCAGDGPACVGGLGLAFFVARDGQWTLITYGKTFTCRFIASTMHQARLPSGLCTKALHG